MSRQSDQDRSLERLLRTSLAEDGGRVTAACLDAERLAAWSDGALSPSERASIEEHLASCARCLSVLAAFADAVPPATAPTSFWRWSPARWLVPVTTAAAALVIWMVIPQREPAPAFATSTQTALDEAATVAPAAPVAQPFGEQSADQAREFAARQAPAPPPPPPSAKGAGAMRGGERRRDEEIAVGSVRAVERPAEKTADSAAVPQRAANELAASDQRAMAAPPPPSARPAAPAATLMRAETMTVEIHSPDPSYRWRIRGTVVERSTTAGASWQPAVVPSGAIVTAGASPVPNVCWLVGPAGTVLRTADGSRFESANISGAGSLVSVQATDANRATVTALDGHVYSTTDGGRTWSR